MRVRRAGLDALLALGADAAVETVARRVASFRLGHGRLDLREAEGGGRSRAFRGGRPHGSVADVRRLAAQDLLLVHDLEEAVHLEAVERLAGDEAVDHVGGTAALANGPGDVRGAGGRVARGEDPWNVRLERSLVRGQGAVLVGADPAAVHGTFGRHPDGGDDGVARDRELRALDGFGAAAAGGVRLAEGHALAAQPGHAAGGVADDLDRSDQE